MNEYNTLALAYTNDNGEVLAWSSDTFGTASKYPKTYKDTEDNRKMLSNKFKTKDEFARKTANFLSEHNSFGGALMSTSLESNKKVFEDKGITRSFLVTLDLYTDYTRGIDLPKWKDVKDCVDNKKYQIL